ncbi:MAG: hypothetical protein PHH84_06880 [Oscillospiraceae bacterium]|nr:hypothetical protein [Oscillospiraceae bacterium]MDD4414825.1 hypothetical protein [Oscillospiraceae bacterium]
MSYDENDINVNESVNQNGVENSGINQDINQQEVTISVNSEEYINQSADIPVNQDTDEIPQDNAVGSQTVATGTQDFNHDSIMGSSVINQPYMASELVMTKKRTNTKAIVIAAVASLIFIIGVVGALSWFMLRPDIKMIYMEPNKYLQELEVRNASSALDKLNNSITAKDTGIDKYKVSSVLSADLSTDKENMLADGYKQYINNSKIEINTEMDKKANLGNSEVKISFNNDMINCSLESIINADKMVFRVPQANEKYILIDENFGSFNDLDGILKKLTGEDMAEIVEIFEGYYKDTFISSLSESDTTFNTSDKYEGIKLNSLTTRIDREVAENILENFASKLEDDDEIVKIIYNITQSSFSKNQRFAVTESQIKEAIIDLAQSLKQSAQNLDEFDTGKLKIYFDNNERIIAREISDKKFVFTMHSYTGKGKDQFKIAFSDEEKSYELFNIEMDGKFTENGFDGNFCMTLKDNSHESTIFNIDWVSNADKKGCSGDITIEIYNRNTITLKYDTSKPAVNNVTLPVGNYTIQIKADSVDYKVLIEVEEVKKDSEYKTTILFNDVSKLLGNMFEGISLELKMDTVFTKLDKVAVKDIDTLETIDYKDIDFIEYFAPLSELFGLDSIIPQPANPMEDMHTDDEMSFDNEISFDEFEF